MLLIYTACTQSIRTDPNLIKGFFSQLDELRYNSTPGVYSGRPFLIDSIVVDKETFWQIASNEPLFSASDKKYIKGQLVADTLGVWSSNLFDNIKVVPYSFIDSAETQNKNRIRPPYIKLSKPYFSKDNKYCLLYYHYYCGNLCAETTLKLYKVINGKWTIIKNYYQIVS